jgi:2-desacetyl-2-hydroxyethyl bacteriochlorophyllide A dehydrogenase
MAGVCGTDFHIFNGEAPSKPPVILGHEYCGEVVEFGNRVEELKIGDKVAINPNINCGYCEYCKSGKINLCKNLIALGVTRNGGFAEYSNVPVSQVYLLPENMNSGLAVFAEPLSCCIHGLNQAEIGLDDRVAIIGAGTIGLLMLQLAKLKGAKEIIVIEPVPEKRKLSEQLGALITVDPVTEEFHKYYKDIAKGGADVVIECVGNVDAVETAFKIVRKGGRIISFGLSNPSAPINLNLQMFFHKELTVKSSLLNPFTFQTAVNLLVDKKLTIDLFKTNLISLNTKGIQKLFYQPRNPSVMKYMITP